MYRNNYTPGAVNIVFSLSKMSDIVLVFQLLEHNTDNNGHWTQEFNKAPVKCTDTSDLDVSEN